MKMISVTFLVPEKVDDYYKGKAERRMCPKSMLLRDAVLEHYDKQPDKDEFKPQPQPKQPRRALAA